MGIIVNTVKDNATKTVLTYERQAHRNLVDCSIVTMRNMFCKI